MGAAPLILGDQGVEELGVAAKGLAATTLRDLLSPVEGWGRIARDYQRCWARDLSGVTGAALNPGDLLLDPLLILAAPVSFVRYPLAWAIKAPRSFIPLFAVVLGEWMARMIPSISPARLSYLIVCCQGSTFLDGTVNFIVQQT